MLAKRVSKIYFTSLFLVLLTAVTVTADDSAVSRATLAGLQGVKVVVEELPANVQQYAAAAGLTSAEIRRDVDQKLGKGKIRVVEGKNWLNVPGRPVLSVVVNTHEKEKYWYAYDIKIELRQLAYLETNPKVRTLAGTWSLSITGVANTGNLQVIRQDVGVLAERFVKAYQAANGK